MAYSLDIVRLFIRKRINNLSVMAISKYLDIFYSTGRYWNIKYDYFIKNKINITIDDKLSYTKSKTVLYESKIIDYVNNNNYCILNNIKDHIDNALSRSSICRVLKKNKITHKRINKHVIYGNENTIHSKRCQYIKNFNKNNFKNVIAIDETGFKPNINSNYGYAKSNKKINRTR